MRTIAGALAVVAMSVSGLTGCGDSTEEFCALEDEFNQIESGEASINDARSAIDQLQDTAPDEIRDDVDTVADAVTGYFDALEDSGVDPDSASAQVPEPTEEVQSALENLQSEEVTEAGDNVEAFVDENC
jgi:hypothetical protein